MDVIDDADDFTPVDGFDRFKVTITFDMEDADTIVVTGKFWWRRNGCLEVLIAPHKTKMFPLDKILEATVEDRQPPAYSGSPEKVHQSG